MAVNHNRYNTFRSLLENKVQIFIYLFILFFCFIVSSFSVILFIQVVDRFLHVQWMLFLNTFVSTIIAKGTPPEIQQILNAFLNTFISTIVKFSPLEIRITLQ